MEDKSFTDINLNELEKEWIWQPKLRRKYSRQLADARKDLSEFKAELKVVESEVRQRVRKKPRAHGLDKVTEGALDEVMHADKRYQESLTKVRDAQHKVDVLEGVVQTIQDRKTTLENLTTLWAQSYFEARLPKGVSDEVKDKVRLRQKRDLRSRGRDVG